jgi:hypothetical protein
MMRVELEIRLAAKWAPDHDEALKRLIGENCSYTVAAAQINTDFGTVYTRNAAIGRAHRIGLAALCPHESQSGRSTQGKAHRGQDGGRRAGARALCSAIRAVPEARDGRLAAI